MQRGGETIQESIDQIIAEEGEEGRLATREEVDLAAASQDEAPVIRLVNQIITRAVNIGASDIHFEPEEKMMRIRVRIDGVLIWNGADPQIPPVTGHHAREGTWRTWTWPRRGCRKTAGPLCMWGGARSTCGSRPSRGVSVRTWWYAF